jgi:K+-transporting ATPase A subunit
VASQESIKLLSSDGGEYFNANSAHSFENPTPLTNFVEMLLMLAVPAGMTYTWRGKSVWQSPAEPCRRMVPCLQPYSSARSYS